MSARSSFAAFLATASRLHGSRMLIDAMRIVARESGFTLVEHKLGFTAYRPNDDRYLLFCLSTGEWAIYGAATAIEVAKGSGIASLVAIARQYFDLPAETAEAVQRQYAA